MNNIYGINGFGGPHPLQPQSTSNSDPPRAKPVPGEKADQVEISDIARLLHKIAQLPDIRPDKVQQMQRSIAQGTYETEEKLSVALDQLLDDYWQE